MLVVHDRVHGIIECLLPLFDGVDKPFGCVYLLLDKKHGLFLALVFFAARSYSFNISL